MAAAAQRLPVLGVRCAQVFAVELVSLLRRGAALRPSSCASEPQKCDVKSGSGCASVSEKCSDDRRR